MWHHIQLVGGGSNDYDDHQGLLISEAGPFATLDVVDLAIMVGFDASGMSINYGKSLGPKHYESPGGDGLPATVHRAKYEWQFLSLPHTAFEPVDNLGQYGWNVFRDPAGQHPVEYLGYPLHAIGDATVPMHVAGTPAWGHRPFEDAAERIWHQLRLEVDAARDLVAAVDALKRGRTYFTPKVASMVLDGYLKKRNGEEEPSTDPDRLTPRERQVVQLLAEGKSSKEVAVTLNLSVKTAETHRSNIMRKLGLHSVGELVLYAVRNNIVQVTQLSLEH